MLVVFIRVLLGSLCVFAFLRVRVGSLRSAKGWSCSFGIARVYSGVPSGRRVPAGSSGFIQARLVVECHTRAPWARRVH